MDVQLASLPSRLHQAPRGHVFRLALQTITHISLIPHWFHSSINPHTVIWETTPTPNRCPQIWVNWQQKPLKKKPPRLPIMPPPPRPHTKARGLAAFSTWKSQPPHHHHSFRFTFGTDRVTVPFFLLFNHPKQSPVAPRLASKPSECNDSFSKLSPAQINSLLMLLA